MKKPSLRNASKNIKEAADKAEARSRAAKAKDKPKGAKPAAAAKPMSAVDPEMKSLFLKNKAAIAEATRKKDTAVSNLRKAYKTAKADGFTKFQFDVAFKLDTPEGENQVRLAIADQLVVARYQGNDIGQQLDMFMEPSRVPAVDRAFEEGQTASMENKPAKPSYAPETEQYREYMRGFHEHQASLAAGIKEKPGPNGHKLITKEQKEAAAKAKPKAPAPAPAPAAAAPPNGGVPMTRSQMRAKLAADGEALFQKKPEAEAAKPH